MTNLDAVAESITEPWKPVVVAEANGFHMKVAKLRGEFPWHVHEREDELFYCTEGSFVIELQDGDPVTLGPGDVHVVPAGRKHRPIAEQTATAVLFERAETKQYGD